MGSNHHKCSVYLFN